MMSAIEYVKQLGNGISIGNTLDSFSNRLNTTDGYECFETAWFNPLITETFVKSVIDRGIRLIRIPVTWTGHFQTENGELRISENWMNRIQTVVDYAYTNGATVILNVHHEDWNTPSYENEDSACKRMCQVWTLIANRFSQYGERLIFEGQNEPRKIGTDVEWNGGDAEGWDVVNKTNRVFVETVRKTGGENAKRYLMIPGYGANCKEGIRHIELPQEDDRIIISVHAYEPYDFALELPGRKAWENDTETLEIFFSELKERFLNRQVPVIIGEFGAMNRDNLTDRCEWLKYYTEQAKKLGIPCVWWDNGLFEGNGELFGLFDRQSGAPVYPELVDILAK